MADATPAERFADTLAALGGGEGRLGLAVSGGPDSLAMLLLAAEVCPGRTEVATVDHLLRAGSREEAEAVAALCIARGLPHSILTVETPPAASGDGLQANARACRYVLLDDWAKKRGLSALLTAHHADDQAETLLMRLARGAGIAGLSGVRARREGAVPVLRPLLGFRKSELIAIVTAAGLNPADDPSNRDDRFDRKRARTLLATTEWIDPLRVVQSAAALAQAEEALLWATDRAMSDVRIEDSDRLLDPADLPPELLRRLVLRVIADLAPDHPPPNGPDLSRLIARLHAGKYATLGRVKASPGTRWRFSPAPPHRSA